MGWGLPLLTAPFVGSFLGVLVARLPAGWPIWSRSRCDHCGTALRMREIVPVLSYAALAGRCHQCRALIPAFHWQLELAAIAAVLLGRAAGLDGLALWAIAVAGWLLLAVAWIDWRTSLVPDRLTVALFGTGLAASAALRPAVLLDHVLAAGLAYLLLREIAAVVRRRRGRDALHAGDLKLAGGIGAWVGLVNLPGVFLGAAVAALLCGAVLRRRGDLPVPFGPFLAAIAFLLLLIRWPLSF